MKVMAIDIETMGLDPDEHQIIEIAFIHYNALNGNMDRFHRYLLPRNGVEYLGTPYCRRLHEEMIGKIINSKVTAVTEQQAIDDLIAWLTGFGYGRFNKGFVPLGKNVTGFDLQFLKKLPRAKERLVHKHRAIDIGTLMLRKTDEVPPDLAECKRRAGLEPSVRHLAMDDAEDCLEIFNVWFNSSAA